MPKNIAADHPQFRQVVANRDTLTQLVATVRAGRLFHQRNNRWSNRQRIPRSNGWSEWAKKIPHERVNWIKEGF